MMHFNIFWKLIFSDCAVTKGENRLQPYQHWCRYVYCLLTHYHLKYNNVSILRKEAVTDKKKVWDRYQLPRQRPRTSDTDKPPTLSWLHGLLSLCSTHTISPDSHTNSTHYPPSNPLVLKSHGCISLAWLLLRLSDRAGKKGEITAINTIPTKRRWYKLGERQRQRRQKTWWKTE